MTELCCLFASFWSVHRYPALRVTVGPDAWFLKWLWAHFCVLSCRSPKWPSKPSGNVSVLPKGFPHVIEITIFCLVETFSLPDGAAQPSNALTVRVKFRPVPSSWGTHAHIHSSLDENVVRNLFLRYTILLEQHLPEFQYHPCLCNGSWIFLSLHPHV